MLTDIFESSVIWSPISKKLQTEYIGFAALTKKYVIIAIFVPLLKTHCSQQVGIGVDLLKTFMVSLWYGVHHLNPNLYRPLLARWCLDCS